MTPTIEEIRAVPKVLLHDHLDGGLRPATVVDLARDIGYDQLPSQDVDEVARWLRRGAHRGHLNLYLDAFQHTVAVMQTPEALTRVAAECAEDLAADGVVYAEVRFAPELHVSRGLTLEQVVAAVLEGFRIGSAGRGITVYALLTAMRTAARSLEIAELAVRHRDEGVVGFDIAGAEAGSPPTRHLDAFQYVARENFHITIHAGEGFGLPSIWEALQWCGADRLGHGVRIVDDIRIGADGTASLGRLASYVRDQRVPLEMCPSSNVQTGAAPSIEEHPIGLLRQLSFRVTVNTDNRLMSGVTLSSEFHRLAEAFGYGWSDFEWLTINAMKSAFAHFDERLRIIDTVIKPGFATARAASDAVVRVHGTEIAGKPGSVSGQPAGQAVTGTAAGLAKSRQATGPPRSSARTRALRQVLHGLPGIDQVGAQQRAAALATRSIKREAKLWALDAAIRMIDLTTLEGADTPGKVRGLCAKARRPDPQDAAVPPVAAVCVYPDLVALARRGAGRQRRGGRLGGHRVPVRARLARGQAGRRRGRGGRRGRRGGHGDRPGCLPGWPVRPGQRRDPGGPRGLRVRAPQGDPGDRGTGHPGQRGPGVLAGHAVRCRLHQDLHRQGLARRHPAGRPGHAGRGGRLRRRHRPPGRGEGGRRGAHRQGRHPLPGAGQGDRRPGLADPGPCSASAPPACSTTCSCSAASSSPAPTPAPTTSPWTASGWAVPRSLR